MPRLSMVPTLLREITGARGFPREPEPALVMDGAAEVAAYTEAGRINGVMAAAYLFHSARISQVIQGCQNVVDLGCGPATQLAQIAELNPDISFHGVDLSPAMLDSAEAHIRESGLGNVQFSQGDITQLDHIADHSVDAVISTMALHHLPTLAHLNRCFGEIARILKPGGAVYVVDFGRLKSLKSVLYFAYMNAKHQPHLFSLDYERSLRAAFLPGDFLEAAQAHLPGRVQMLSTFMMPILVILKTGDKPLPGTLQSKIRAMRKALPARYRRDLDDIRVFFRMGGLDHDPFA